MTKGECICEWQGGCAGLGTLYCEGCGGDLCICLCGGEAECPGCDFCFDEGQRNDWGADTFGGDGP